MGLVNTVVPLERARGARPSVVPRDARASPFALRLLKASFNADEDGLAGIQQLAHDANLLFYMSEEAQEGRHAYIEKRRRTSRSSPGAPEPMSTARHAPSGARIWLMAARLRTLPAAIAPVLVGTSLAGYSTSSTRCGSSRR